MTRYLSDFPCGKCGEKEVYDSNAETVCCGCGTFTCHFVNLKEFREIPLDQTQRTLQK
jgi:hypothetical protein